jgi:uncharacterized protein
VRFWDTSALLPLVIEEPRTLALRPLMERFLDPVVSFITPLELDAAVRRRTRALNDVDDVKVRHLMLHRELLVISEVDATIKRARRLIARHRLRAADAIQLAAAILAREQVQHFPVITLDAELAAAAKAEGFTVLPDA